MKHAPCTIPPPCSQSASAFFSLEGELDLERDMLPGDLDLEETPSLPIIDLPRLVLLLVAPMV